MNYFGEDPDHELERIERYARLLRHGIYDELRVCPVCEDRYIGPNEDMCHYCARQDAIDRGIGLGGDLGGDADMDASVQDILDDLS
jgi:hypothetical protein